MFTIAVFAVFQVTHLNTEKTRDILPIALILFLMISLRSADTPETVKEQRKSRYKHYLSLIDWISILAKHFSVARSRRQAFKHFEKDNLALQIFRNVGKFVQADMYKYNKYIYSESISQVWNAFCALLFTHVCWNQLYKLYLVELWNFTNIFSASIK